MTFPLEVTGERADSQPRQRSGGQTVHRRTAKHKGGPQEYQTASVSLSCACPSPLFMNTRQWGTQIGAVLHGAYGAAGQAKVVDRFGGTNGDGREDRQQT